MLRFILSRKETLGEFGEHGVEQTLETLDVSIPELEAALLRGGSAGVRFDLTQLVGVEVLREAGGESDA